MKIDLPDCGNGVYEAGIAAGSDEFTDEEKRLWVCYRAPLIFECTIAALEGYDEASWGADSDDGKPTILGLGIDEVFLDLLSDSDPRVIPGSMPFATFAKALEDYRALAEGKKVISPELTVMCAYKGFDTDVVTSVFLTGVVFICKGGWVLGPGNTAYVTHLSIAASKALYDRVVAEKRATAYRPEAEVNRLLKHNIQDIITLLAACKITYFMTNHHVGVSPDGPTGYVGKCVGALTSLNGVNRADLRVAIWMLGKYISTRGMLSALGIPGLLPTAGTADASLMPINVKPAADLKLRTTANPAGTANIGTYLAGVRALCQTAYLVAIPRIDGFDEALAAEKRIKANPAAYHMGAFFLVGAPRIEEDPFTAQDKENISAGVHALLGKTMLAKGDAFIRLDEVKSSTVYEMLTAIKAQVITMSTDAVTAYLIRHNTLGAARGGLALQSGKITQKTIEDAEAAVKLEEEEAVAKKAAGAVVTSLLPKGKK